MSPWTDAGAYAGLPAPASGAANKKAEPSVGSACSLFFLLNQRHVPVSYPQYKFKISRYSLGSSTSPRRCLAERLCVFGRRPLEHRAGGIVYRNCEPRFYIIFRCQCGIRGARNEMTADRDHRQVPFVVLARRRLDQSTSGLLAGKDRTTGEPFCYSQASHTDPPVSDARYDAYYSYVGLLLPMSFWARRGSILRYPGKRAVPPTYNSLIHRTSGRRAVWTGRSSDFHSPWKSARASLRA